jgi:hypothetical protein
MKKVKVNIRGLKRYVGYSDLITTYCCSSQPTYFIKFPAIEYSGYFSIYDVREL